MKFTTTLLLALTMAASVSATSSYNTTSSNLLPSFYNGLPNVWDTSSSSFGSGNNIPFYWYIGNTGGAMFSDIVAECLPGAVQISAKGDSTGNTIPQAPPVQIVTHQDNGAQYLNVNPNSQEGLDLLVEENALSLGDILISPKLQESASLSGSGTVGQALTMLRHPVKRDVAQFYWRQAATWDPMFDLQLATMSLDLYVKSNKVIDNFYVRTLNGNLPMDLRVEAQHVEIAKNALREKFIVGIYEWPEASVKRFEDALGWTSRFEVETSSEVNQCHAAKLETLSKVNNPMVESGGDLWGQLIIRHWADVELYTYAKHLFAEQGKLLSTASEEA